MATTRSAEQHFRVTVGGDEKSRVFAVLPVDDVVRIWGERERYYVAGTVDGRQFRGALERAGERLILPFGPAWRRDHGIGPGDTIDLRIGLEGPLRSELAPDIAEALEAEPAAAVFFDSIAQFYRKGYLRWIDATKRSPEIRAQRITETVRRLKDGKKHPPR